MKPLITALALVLATPAYSADFWGSFAGGAAGGAAGSIIGNIISQPRQAPQPQYYQPAPPPQVVYRQAPQQVIVLPPRPPAGPDEIAYCSRKYRSWDYKTGYFFGYDGQYHPCP